MYGPTPPVPSAAPSSPAYPEPGPYPGAPYAGQPTAHSGPFVHPAYAGYLVVPQAPPRRSPARHVGLIALRTVLACLPLATIGILSWAPLLRTALVRRRPWDWVALIVTGVLAFWGFAAVGSSNEDSLECDAGMGTLLLLAVGCTVYFLVTELRPQPSSQFVPPPYGAAQFGAPPYGAAQFGAPPFTAAHPAGPHQVPPQYGAPHWAVQAAQAAPPLVPLGQVQAELDELSALLHRHERPSA